MSSWNPGIVFVPGVGEKSFHFVADIDDQSAVQALMGRVYTFIKRPLSLDERRRRMLQELYANDPASAKEYVVALLSFDRSKGGDGLEALREELMGRPRSPSPLPRNDKAPEYSAPDGM